jgi:putative membrane protein
MTTFITRTLVVALALLVAAEVIPGIAINSLTTAILSAVVLGVLNSTVKPLLIILTLPFTILTLGLFLIVINATTVALAAYLLPGFTIANIWTAIAASLFVSVASIFVNRTLPKD